MWQKFLVRHSAHHPAERFYRAHLVHFNDAGGQDCICAQPEGNGHSYAKSISHYEGQRQPHDRWSAICQGSLPSLPRLPLHSIWPEAKAHAFCASFSAITAITYTKPLTCSMTMVHDCRWWILKRHHMELRMPTLPSRSWLRPRCAASWARSLWTRPLRSAPCSTRTLSSLSSESTPFHHSDTLVCFHCRCGNLLRRYSRRTCPQWTSVE